MKARIRLRQNLPRVRQMERSKRKEGEKSEL